MSRAHSRRRGGLPLLVLAFGAAVALSAPSGVSAQLSPGPLAAPHAELEGSTQCLRCHSSGRGVDPELCLSCHGLLATRIASGEGLHAGAEYADCKSCHIDHHGRDFELIWWGEGGMEAFDHELTGYPLVGAHGDLGCRECHREERNPAAADLRRAGKDPARSFLGLGTECLSCHRDEHRGQFEGARCASCHDQVAWSPASGFDHDRASFPLTGLHRQVRCEACHSTVEAALGADADFLRFVGLDFAACSSCHRDPHAGRFGARCEECHQTSGWRRVDDSRFDHDLTRYPLRGRHRSVPCASCHRAGAPRRGLAFQSCTDCHRDEHVGQLARRSDGGRCESCHTVEGFRPSSFDLDDHDVIFVLEGAHRSVACERCHEKVPLGTLVDAGLASPVAAGGGSERMQLRFASTDCASCHEDPHAGSAVSDGRALACEACHRPTTWSETGFDHSSTGFELVGAHTRLDCARCHRPSDAAEAQSPVAFSGLGTTCVSCHSDPHRGQLTGAGGVTECVRCHQTDTWIPATGFDHGRDASFALAGAHARVPCDGCHRPERDREGEFVRFRPLPSRCSDCHGGAS